MTILVLAAHPDDEVIGVGGTIAKLSKKEDIYVIIFTFGSTFPYSEDKYRIAEKRIKESFYAAKILGIKDIYFIGADFKMNRIHKDKFLINRIQKVIKDLNPRVLFYHSLTDGHPDHRAVHRFAKRLKGDFERYTFEVTSPFDLISSRPKLYVDITNVFHIKMKAIEYFISQKQITWFFRYYIPFKARIAGKIIGTKYAEVFIKDESRFWS